MILDAGSLAASAAAVAMVAGGAGDVVLAGMLVGLAAGGPAAIGAGLLSGVAVLVRWGSPSIAAAAGAQAVFGMAGAVGPPAAVASTWLAALALVVVAAAGVSRSRAPVAAAGAVAAAFVVAGPAGRGGVGIRLAATGAALVLAGLAVRLPRRVAVPLALCSGLVAVVLAAVA